MNRMCPLMFRNRPERHPGFPTKPSAARNGPWRQLSPHSCRVGSHRTLSKQHEQSQGLNIIESNQRPHSKDFPAKSGNAEEMTIEHVTCQSEPRYNKSWPLVSLNERTGAAPTPTAVQSKAAKRNKAIPKISQPSQATPRKDNRACNLSERTTL